jgi:membrane protease YdiL (CAAX protease family)
MSNTPSQPSAAESPARETDRSPSGWRHSKELIVAELVAFAALFVANWENLVWLSKTPWLLLLGWISLRLRRIGWKQIGWGLYGSWPRTLAIGIAAGIAFEAFELFVTNPLLTRLTGTPPDLEDFRPLIGNFKLLPLGLAAAWSLAAFGEELVYRGYLMNRLADLANPSRAAWIFSLIAASLAFALAHTYQGPAGVAEAGIDGFLLGLLYLGCDRSLSLPIIAHGVTDTVDVLLIFLGRYPGM